MRIMTYNVQSGRDAWGQLHLEGTARAIFRLAPDVCGLNEIRVGCADSEGIDQAAYLGEKTGMHARFARAIPLVDGQYGIALLSRYPIGRFDVHPVPDVPLDQREPGYYENRVIYRAEIETPEGMLAVYGSHFGLTRPERRAAVKLLLSLLETEKLAAVFMGDLNMSPDDELIGSIKGVMRSLHPARPCLTHHVLRMHDTIDYIFVSKGIRATDAFASYSVASDHLPVLAEIHLPGSREAEQSARIERIVSNEQRFDRITGAVNGLKDALQSFESLRTDIEQLTAYYENEWKQDFEADEQGLLPRDLKRGVLSEDAVYDLLEEIGNLDAKLQTPPRK